MRSMADRLPSSGSDWIGQHLLDQRPPGVEPAAYYWVREKTGALAEVGYLLGNHVVPIEVKAGSSTKTKSLHVFLNEKNTSPHGVHFSSAPSEWLPKLRILRLPFYLVEQTPRLISRLL